MARPSSARGAVILPDVAGGREPRFGERAAFGAQRQAGDAGFGEVVDRSHLADVAGGHRACARLVHARKRCERARFRALLVQLRLERKELGIGAERLDGGEQVRFAGNNVILLGHPQFLGKVDFLYIRRIPKVRKQ